MTVRRLADALTGDDEHRDPLDQRVRQVEGGRCRKLNGTLTWYVNNRTPGTIAAFYYPYAVSSHAAP